MKMTTVREFRNSMAALMSEPETVLVTKNGKPAGFFVPWKDKKELPIGLKKSLFAEISNELKKEFESINEEGMLADFAKWRKNK